MAVKIFTVFDEKPFNVKGLKRHYDKKYIDVLFRLLKRNVTIPFELEVIRSEYPGWWGKMEIFKEKKGFYLDLSTYIRDDITHLITHDHTFTACRDFIFPEMLNSKVMAWDGNFSYMWSKFTKDSKNIMSRYTANVSMWGDQSYIDHNIGKRAYFQDIFPGSIVSYRRDKDHSNALIVAFHGNPKPHETEYWNEFQVPATGHRMPQSRTETDR